MAGTGLSLTLVKRVADAHGAPVEVEPRTGGPGLCIRLRLPVQPPQPAR